MVYLLQVQKKYHQSAYLIGQELNPKLQKLLQSQIADSDGIYISRAGFSADQSAKIELCERVAAEQYDNLLDAINRNHSGDGLRGRPVPGQATVRGFVLDIGGCCWG